MTVLVAVGDVVSTATALVALRDRSVATDDIVMLVGDMDVGSEIRPDPRTAPEIRALASGVRRLESLNALIWPQSPQGWRASDIAVDGVGRLLVELEDTLEEVMVADDHPAWEILARACRSARVTRLSVGPNGYATTQGSGTPVGSSWVHLDPAPTPPTSVDASSVPASEVAALLAPLRSGRQATGTAVWVPHASDLLARDTAEVEALLTVAARYGTSVQVLGRDLPPLPHGWFHGRAAGELLQGASLVTDHVGAEIALLRYPAKALVTADRRLAARARVLGVSEVRLVDESGRDSRYAMMVPSTRKTGRPREGQDAVKDDESRAKVAPGRALPALRMSKLSVLLTLAALIVGSVAVVLVDSLVGTAAALAGTALLLGGLGTALAAAVVWEIRAHRHDVRAGHRRLEATLSDVHARLSELDDRVRGQREQLAAIEQRDIVVAAMQERTIVTVDDLARVAAVLAVRAETAADQPDNR